MPKKTPAPISERLPVPIELIERRIYLIRGRKVMLDTDLAELYRVPTFRLNEAVKRNLVRFPKDFMFQLSPHRDGMFDIANCDVKKRARRTSYPAICL